MRSCASTWLLTTIVTVVGCSPQNGGSPTAAGMAAYDAFAKGIVAFEAKDWSAAEKDLSAALKGPGIQADQREQALFALIKSRIELGQIDVAESDLMELERGAGEMDRFYLLKCEWALKKGDRTAAKVAFDEARRINRATKPPEGLQ